MQVKRSPKQPIKITYQRTGDKSESMLEQIIQKKSHQGNYTEFIKIHTSTMENNEFNLSGT